VRVVACIADACLLGFGWLLRVLLDGSERVPAWGDLVPHDLRGRVGLVGFRVGFVGGFRVGFGFLLLAIYGYAVNFHALVAI